ncbi:MAG TPA: polysaccharide biosynthesis/export family protein [Vineibacter sp.]|nr:polysaccharide biosynthesis/export family protein [Vineibacter sp.]
MTKRFMLQGWIAGTKVARAGLALASVLALAACETGGTSSSGVACPSTKALVGGLDYKLGIGDRLKVTVVGQPELGGEAEVDAGGKVVIALAGEVIAVDRTVGQVQSEIVSKMRGTILVDPRISVQVMAYRPVTVLGLVKLPGRYPYSFGLDVRGASALAGGLERRASPDRSVIFRTGAQCDAKPDTPLYPGDTIEILRRGG